MAYTEEDIKIGKRKGFQDAVLKLYKNKKLSDAYEEIEDRHMEIYGERMFKNYESFNRSLNYHRKK